MSFATVWTNACNYFEHLSTFWDVIWFLGFLSFLGFIRWSFKSAVTLWALNVMFEHSGKEKMSHGIKSYAAISILKDEIHEVLR